MVSWPSCCSFQGENRFKIPSYITCSCSSRDSSGVFIVLQEPSRRRKKPKRATLNVQLSACADLTAYGKTLMVLHTPIINSEKTTNNNLSARDVNKYELSSLVISFRMSPSYQYMEGECSQHSEQKLL
jgi:hypothetical protein